jgi:hypothetical protein
MKPSPVYSQPIVVTLAEATVPYKYLEKAGHELLYVVNVVEVVRQRVRHVDSYHLPVRLALQA